MSSVNSWVKHYKKEILLVVVLALMALLFWELRRVLLPFVLGLLLAWLLQPAIDALERRLPGRDKHHRRNRLVTIVAIFLVTATLIGLGIFYVVTLLGRSLVLLVTAAPDLIPRGIEALQESLESFLLTLPSSTRAQIESLLAQAGSRASDALVGFVTGSVVQIRGSSNMILGFVSLPVFLFYLLKDWERLRNDFYGPLPSWLRTHVRNVAAIVHNVVGRYVRGQLILGLAVGLAIYVLLTIAGIPYAVPLAVFGGIAEIVPVIGPWLAGIVGILVVLATAPDKILWVALGYIVIQLLENNLLVPRIQGRQMRLHPALVIVLTLVAASRFGILGFLLVLPVTMMIVELTKYVRAQRRQPDEIWR
ncbi:MAG: AI-2E family transporter [Chloroflexota bacterium]